MFRKTLIQLTGLNTVLLILMLALLGGVIYFYEKAVTFRSADQMLSRMEPDRVFVLQGRLDGPEPADPRSRNPRVIGLIMDKDRELFLSSFGDTLTDEETITFFKPLLPGNKGTVEEKNAHGNVYHVISRTLRIQGESYTAVYAMDVSVERNLLNTLLSIIIYGLLTGAFVSVIVGYFLARGALRPIQKAWDKQNRFVADASHELRTPLSILQLKIEGLLRRPRKKIQESGEDIAVMLGETRRLSKLVGNLLTLARSDANRLEVNLKPLDLQLMVKKVSEPFAEMAEFEGKAFRVTACEPLVITGDEQRIHQLLVILLDNAMKFTSAEGHISVRADKDGKMARLSVSDSGVGISEADLPHVFDRFFQADASRSDERGTGLGLSIASWIVARHHGKIDVTSAINQGTTFTVRLPLEKDVTAKQLTRDKEDDTDER